MMSARADFFDRIAFDWDSWETEESYARMRNVLKRLRLHPDMRILDVGCGTGNILALLEKVYRFVPVMTGIDTSFNMLQCARRKYADRYSLMRGDFLQHPFQEKSFDLVLFFSMFPHFQDQKKALQIAASLLKKGGSAIVAHFVSRDEINGFHKAVAEEVSKDLLPPHHRMKQMFQEAGFSHVYLENGPDGYVVRGLRTA